MELKQKGRFYVTKHSIKERIQGALGIVCCPVLANHDTSPAVDTAATLAVLQTSLKLIIGSLI